MYHIILKSCLVHTIFSLLYSLFHLQCTSSPSVLLKTSLFQTAMIYAVIHEQGPIINYREWTIQKMWDESEDN